MAMNIDKINQWLTLVANFGVLAGIVFLGFEIRQNSAAITSQAAFQLNLSMDNSYRTIAQSPDLAKFVRTGYESPESLSESQRNQFFYWMRADINAHEAAWFYFDKGLISEGDYSGYQSALCDRIGSPGGKLFWSEGKTTFSIGFIESIEEMC